MGAFTEINTVREAELPGPDLAGAGDIIVAPHCHDRAFGVIVEVTGQADGGVDVVVAAIRVRAAHAEEDHAELCFLHDLDRLLDLLPGNTGNDFRDVKTPEHGPERVEELVVVALVEHEVVVGEFRGVGLTRVDTEDHPLHLTLLGEVAAGEDRVPGGVAGVGVHRVAAPEDHDIGTVLRFTERAARVPVVEHRQERGAVADGCTVVEHGTGFLGNPADCAHTLAVG